MVKISKEEVLKIAEISHIKLAAGEAESLALELQDVLSYAERVAQLTDDIKDTVAPLFNITRSDQIKKPDIIDIQGHGPDTMSGYFVVPLILDQQ